MSIHSEQNPKFKHVRQLLQSSQYRSKQQAFVLETPKLISDFYQRWPDHIDYVLLDEFGDDGLLDEGGDDGLLDDDDVGEDGLSDEMKAIHNYRINNTAHYGKILIKRYISSSFLGLSTKIWKLKQFRFIGPYFEFWRIGQHNNAKKINLKYCSCSKLYSSMKKIPIDLDNLETSIRYVYTFKINKYRKKVLEFASLRLDSIERLYYKFNRLLNLK